MSEFSGVAPAKRGQVLLIVEGAKQEPQFLMLLSRCFPNLSISKENIITYCTNIYVLYDEIVKEYGTTWFEDKEDIDLPFIVTRKSAVPLRKTSFTDIILIFDYERQDPYFTEKKIANMQSHFSDTTDMGKLYINYPMLASYKDFKEFPDSLYQHKRAFVLPQHAPEGEVAIENYKKAVSDTFVDRSVGFYERLQVILQNNKIDASRLGVVLNSLLSLSGDSDEVALLEQVRSILTVFALPEDKLKALAYQIRGEILKRGYYQSGLDYWTFLQGLIKNIIVANICKANMIQYGKYDVSSGMLKKIYSTIDYGAILREQNRCSAGIDGFLWVLNTGVFFVIDYNFDLIEDKGS